MKYYFITIPYLNLFFLVTIHVNNLELGELINFGCTGISSFLTVINLCTMLDLSSNNLFIIFSNKATLYLLVIKFIIKLCMLLTFCIPRYGLVVESEL